MKRLIWIIMALSMTLTSCGEFFTFEEEPDEWDGVTMHALNDSACIMVGDSLALQCEFLPMNPNGSPVYWMMNESESAKVNNDTLVALAPGKVNLTVLGAAGRLCDTIQVKVIDRWVIEDFSKLNPSDMVIYANIQVDNEPWDDETMIVGAFVREELAGVAIKHQEYGVTYAELRIWAIDDLHVGNVQLRCYDRRNRRLYVSLNDIEFDAYTTLGTLSDLYPININTIYF